MWRQCFPRLGAQRFTFKKHGAEAGPPQQLAAMGAGLRLQIIAECCQQYRIQRQRFRLLRQ